MDNPTPNAQQTTFWNDQGGPRWIALQDLLDRELEPLGQAAMDRVGVAAGERIIDVGCGTGATTLALARRVGADGGILGVDVSRPMLARAGERARAAGVTNVRFEVADAQTFAFAPASADVVFSRFGVMFFEDSIAAFANLRRALRPGGRIGFVCWQAMDRNPAMVVPATAAAQYVTLAAPSAPGAPGPFAFADGERTGRLVSGAGFAEVAVEAFYTTIDVAHDADEAVSFLLQMGPAAAAVREAEPPVRERIAASLREALAPFQGERGIRMPASLWLVTAVNPL